MRHTAARAIEPDAPRHASDTPFPVRDDTRPVHSPVHDMQARLASEMQTRREQAVFDSFSAKQAPVLPSARRMRGVLLVMAGGIGGWAAFYAGSLAGLY